MSIDDAIHNYYLDLADGQQRFGNGGQQRGAAGKLFEDLIDNLIKCTDRRLADSRFVTSREINGLSLGNLQVDKHIVYNDEIETLVESKTFLDSSMLKRAVMDFNEVCLSPDAPHVKKLAVFAGQTVIADVTRVFTLDLCHQLTGIKPEIFVVNTVKKRDGNKQLHDPRYGENFGLDREELERFVSWLQA